jgi:hypothetical protein
MKILCAVCGEKKSRKGSRLITIQKIDWETKEPLKDSKPIHARECAECVAFIDWAIKESS